MIHFYCAGFGGLWELLWRAGVFKGVIMSRYFALAAMAMLATVFIASCDSSKESEHREKPKEKDKAKASASITKADYGKTTEGTPVDLYTLTNKNGMVVKITNYGALVTSILAPDKDGKFDDVTLGFDDLSSYLKPHPYFGATVGRYANRIAKAKFTLDGKSYTLAANNGVNSLHGGVKGFDKVVWKAEPKDDKEEPAVEFKYTSPDGEEGYPGTMNVAVLYTLTKKNELKIDFKATSDKATPINLTHHTYFNLGGAAKGDILGHELQMPAATKFLPVDDALIPTGELKDVSNTTLDFRKQTKIGERIAQVPGGPPGGYDHFWVLEKKYGELTLAANVYHPQSGRGLEVLTTEPGLQFYTGNFLDGTVTGRGGVVYKKNFGLCLEPTHYPDSPNQPKFPSTILKPGETYKHTTIYKFYVKK
jgi:aldose 1-epimerase